MFIYALIYNLLTKDPNGANALMDALDTGAFGADFNAALGYLAAVPDDAVIELDFVATPTLPSWVPSDSLPTVKIGKAELLAEAGTLKLMRGLFQWVKAYNFNFPARTIVQALDLKTGRFTSAIQGPNLLQCGFLSLRDPASLGKSQASLGQGLGDIRTAVELIRARGDDSPFDLNASVAGSIASDLAKLSAVLAQARGAIEAGGSIYLPADPMGLLSGSDDLLAGTGKTEIRLGPLFNAADPLLSVGALIDLNASRSAPLWFADTSEWNQAMVEVGPDLATPATRTNLVYIRLRFDTIAGKLLPSLDPPPKSYVPVCLLTQADRLMAWFGQSWTPPAEVSIGAY
jgi:hypothetical protein